MSKAIQGAAELAGAATLFALMDFATGGLGAAVNTPMFFAIMASLAATGVATEAGALADALTNNRGMNISTRQAAAPRQYIVGMQRVGGIVVYRSTTGSKLNQYNWVIVFSDHVLSAFQSLYLDGRLIYFDDGAGTSERMGISFGGTVANVTATGPDGVQYNFGAGQPLVYCEARYGDQSPGDVIGGLTANDGTWSASSLGSPYLGGCAYFYLKTEFDPGLFPSTPEVRCTVFGVPIFDPRTGETAYTSNAALICGWWAALSPDGLGVPVNQAQLIVAANICDEQVDLAGGGTEARYACHYHWDTSSPPSDVFATLMRAMGGRASMIGGELYLFPAAWMGPSFNYDQSALTAPLNWDSTLSYKDLCNRVTGTYTAPNYPYNVAGNLYDSNGFYDGEIQNNFQFGFTPASYPQYAADPLHGYAADGFLNQDSGVTAGWDDTTSFALGQVVSYTQTIAGKPYASVWRSLVADNVGNTPGPASAQWVNAAVVLPREMSFNMVLSIAQAQRLAKIELMRSRFPGGGQFEMGLGCIGMQECDVMEFSFAPWGWTDKNLEITGATFKTVTRESEPGQPPTPVERRILFDVHETDSSIYEWSTAEEQNIYGIPSLPQQQSTQVAPPTDMVLTSGAATALVQPDGTVIPRIEVSWNAPLDGFATGIEVQNQSNYSYAGAGVWSNSYTVDIALTSMFISPCVAGAVYSVRIRSVRPSGAVSAWVEVDNYTCGTTVSNTQGVIGLDPGSLFAQSGPSSSIIECFAFTALIGQLSLPIFPGGPVTITEDGTVGGAGGPLIPQQGYYVYYIDPNCVGGNVTPIATTNPSDFLGKPGYWLIGPIVTPPYAPYTGTTRLYPGSFADSGTRTTSNPGYAHDGNLYTSANVSASFAESAGGGTPTTGYGIATWYSFVNLSGAYSALNVLLSASFADVGGASGGTVVISATIAGTSYTLATLTAATAKTNYTVAWPYTGSVPADPSTTSVTIECFPGGGSAGASQLVTANVFEIYIQ